MKKFAFTLNLEYLNDFINILKDLSRIDQTVKMKLDSDEILFYSRKGVGLNIHAFKSYIIPTEKLFITTEDIPNLDFIIINCKKFISNLSIYLTKDKVKGTLQYNEGNINAHIMSLNDGRLKLKFITGDYRDIKDISKYDIRTKMDPELANTKFTLTFDQLTEIQKLSKLNNSEITTIKIKDTKLYFTEPTWTYGICELDEEDRAGIALDEVLDEMILQYFDQSGAPVVEQIVEFNPKKRSEDE